MITDDTFDVRAARDRLTRAERSALAKNLSLYERASADASAIVECIIEIAEPDRIYQWGSLLQPELFKEYSDIDIALEGVRDAEVFFRILDEAEKRTSFPVDIVQLEKIEPEFANEIRQEGKLIYERT
jgi:predicted nucleotidyltransferase